MIVDTKWFGLWYDWKFELTYHKCGYFDPHPEIHISLLGLHFLFRLPWKNEKWAEECDPPKYGIQVHNSTFWLCLGGKGNMNGGTKFWTWDLPFFTFIHVKHTVMISGGEMVDSKYLGSNKPYVYYADDPLVLKYQVPYTDSYDGEVVICSYWREYREWRPKWLTWTSLFARKRNYLEIQFDREVGKRKGEWKGGCIGCSYDLLPNETDLECIRRMERERKF